MLIIASKPGRLGNSLFLFANFIGCAAEHGLVVSDPAFGEYADYFEGTAGDPFCRFPARRAAGGGTAAARRHLYHASHYAARLLARVGNKTDRLRAVTIGWEERFDLEDPAFVASLRPRQLVFFQGWQFFSHAAFTKHAGLVREFFRPRADLSANAAALVSRARAGADVVVGVHIRHGDYRTHRGGRYFYDPGTYAALMRRVETLLPGRRVGFVVCSDAAQDVSPFAPFNYRFGTGHPVEDMYALAGCDYLVGPPSTFSMWASFYGGAPLYVVGDPRGAPRLEDFSVYRPGPQWAW